MSLRCDGLYLITHITQVTASHQLTTPHAISPPASPASISLTIKLCAASPPLQLSWPLLPLLPSSSRGLCCPFVLRHAHSSDKFVKSYLLSTKLSACRRSPLPVVEHFLCYNRASAVTPACVRTSAQGIVPEKQRLVYRAKQLQDEDTLGEHNITADKIVFLMCAECAPMHAERSLEISQCALRVLCSIRSATLHRQIWRCTESASV